VPEDIDGMNPFASWSSITWESFRLNYNFLTWYDDDYNPAPDLAESWTTSTDAKTWTFTIRSGVKWQDGEPLTAKDIAFTYNLIIDNDLDAYTGYFVGVKKVTAPTDTTLVIECDKPNAGMLALYSRSARTHLEQGAQNKLDSWTNVPMIGSSPFQVVEAKKSKYVPLSPTSSTRRPTLDAVLFSIYQNPIRWCRTTSQQPRAAFRACGRLQGLQVLRLGDGHGRTSLQRRLQLRAAEQEPPASDYIRLAVVG
jgi:peptide/nickel transport system substrate-binding protein